MSENQRIRHRASGALRVLLPATLILGGAAATAAELDLPWKQAGLSERQAAAHLLDRLAYGARPGEVEAVLEMGLEVWVEAQLGASREDLELERRLGGLDTLAMDAETLARTFPDPGRLLRRLQQSGELPDDFMAQGGDGDASRSDRRDRREMIRSSMEELGYRPQRELVGQLMAQKLLRAVYAENQLQEVLTDFWFNHFNVTVQHNQARGHVLSYERDAIRPHVLGSFRELLEATARHPAMLLYLDNATSRVEPGRTTTLERRAPRAGRGGRPAIGERGQGNPNRPNGLNENYARELLELHTLGVDGGYTQDDVIEVARALTGWVYLPTEAMDGASGMGGMGRRGPRRRMPPPEIAARVGFVKDGLFVFHPGFHDAEKKTVLGHQLSAGRGLEDGLEVLDILAAHPATARHLAAKLAVRFVDDDPPGALVDRLARTFIKRRGDLRATMRALLESPEFWSSHRSKVKSPFELAASALRALGAEVSHPGEAVGWVARIGQPLYSYQAPTGYPDDADFWVNSGALLNRMNFGLQLASEQLRGVRFDLAELNGGREPESLEQALGDYAALLLPGRDSAETRRLLGPVVGSPDFVDRVDGASMPSADGADGSAISLGSRRQAARGPRELGQLPGGQRPRARRPADQPPSALAQVVGLLLGSPEFQRR